ncbi:CaiB/BaiF CoA transferase family protein [Catenisphaera adipataccumulans]|jgi:alpha-methylacyl-CoA racemase|uniref:Crotonobetainyl-CoA:carnitine CoA-transferase CaiB-like acyl-CoA transferase n=1 Tax=Catenisphaera adipataccumulans TaxID=700500 RepID=A0A7W8FWN3_9FIRM|nr:CaiB/BaiF CoA-transferase family protein [Catenisphaera adipataccumulans]MBB5182107.1 crotonobetainyl-CoA:carnitine CoA-transferase CaiB-like acyl-CoA transferase [Catenisphaera adipataccumulans]
MGALDDLKILDFTTLLPGPYATLMLADMGAQVLKITSRTRKDLVEDWPPQIEGTKTTATWAWLNRNKETMWLNLKEPKAVEAVEKLVQEYDIVVEQFRPGVMDRLHLGYEDLKKINPKLIYCSLTGYGQTGPLAHRAGHDINYLARSGIASASGRKSSGPALYNFQIGDVASGAMNLAVSLLSAVHYRDRTGQGQAVDVSMTDGLIPFNSMDGACYLAGAAQPEREAQTLNGGTFYDFYETKDGRYMSVGSLEPKFFKRLCETMGHPEWDRQNVKAGLKTEFLKKTQAEWIEIFRDADACVEPVLDLREASQDEQTNARGMWPNVPIPETGKTIRQMGCPIRLSKCPPAYRHAGYPAGTQTEKILRSLGYTEAEIEKMI